MKSFMEYITPEDEEIRTFDDMTIPELIGIQGQCQEDIGEKIDESIKCNDCLNSRQHSLLTGSIKSSLKTEMHTGS